MFTSKKCINWIVALFIEYGAVDNSFMHVIYLGGEESCQRVAKWDRNGKATIACVGACSLHSSCWEGAESVHAIYLYFSQGCGKGNAIISTKHLRVPGALHIQIGFESSPGISDAKASWLPQFSTSMWILFWLFRPSLGQGVCFWLFLSSGWEHWTWGSMTLPMDSYSNAPLVQNASAKMKRYHNVYNMHIKRKHKKRIHACLTV